MYMYALIVAYQIFNCIYNVTASMHTYRFTLLYADTTDCAALKDKIQECYSTLNRLPITSLLPQLYQEKMLTEDDKKKIEIEQLESDRMQYFLDNVLILSPELDMIEIYKKFIKVLWNSDNSTHHAAAKKLGMSIFTFTYNKLP